MADQEGPLRCVDILRNYARRKDFLLIALSVILNLAIESLTLKHVDMCKESDEVVWNWQCAFLDPKESVGRGMAANIGLEQVDKLENYVKSVGLWNQIYSLHKFP